jgi:hypothetical protein
MPQSFASVTLQIVFSTKDREPVITGPWAPRIHAYLATVCRESTGLVYAVGGVADHVHIATVLPRTLCIADLVETEGRLFALGENPRPAVRRISLAARLWRLLHRPVREEGHDRLCAESSRAP